MNKNDNNAHRSDRQCFGMRGALKANAFTFCLGNKS